MMRQGDIDVSEVNLITTAGRRPLSRRVVLGGLGIGVGAGLLGLTGCAPGGSGRTSIRFVQNKREVLQYFSDLTDRFNESQSEIFVTHDDSPTSLVAQFVRGNYPDVGLYNYNLETSTYLARGMLSDLSDLPEVQTINPAVQDLVTQYAQIEGETNVLPFSVTAAGVVYNRDLFEQNGFETPESWQELLDLCDSFNELGITPIEGTFRDMWTVQQGHFDYTSGSYLDVAGFYQQLRDQGTDVGPDSEVSFQKNFASTADAMKTLFSYSQPNALTSAYPDGNASFAGGTAAMYLQGPWAIGEVTTINPEINVGTFPLNAGVDTDSRRARVNLDLAAWIPNGVSNRDASVTFVQYLMSPDVVNDYNLNNLAFSTLTDAPEQTDERISGLQRAYNDGRFYQGAGTYLPVTIPIQNYLQQFVIDGDSQSLLAKIDTDWARTAQRTTN